MIKIKSAGEPTKGAHWSMGPEVFGVQIVVKA